MPKNKGPSAGYARTEVPKREGLKTTVKMFDPWPDKMPFNYGKGNRKHTSLIRASMFLFMVCVVFAFAIVTFMTMWNHENTLI